MRILLLSSICVMGISSLLIGYDMGSSAILISYFLYERALIDGSHSILRLIWLLGSLGRFIGPLIAVFLTDKIGRRKTMMISGVVFFIGALLRIMATNTIVVIQIGHLITGLAVGAFSIVAPIYLAEIAPKETRGAIVSSGRLAVAIGMIVSYINNYVGVKEDDDGSNTKLRQNASLGVQMALAVLLLFGAACLPASPRWLMLRGRTEDAARCLGRLSGLEAYSTEVQAELDEMQDSLRTEYKGGEGSWSELFANGMWRRIALGIAIQILTGLSGTKVINSDMTSILGEARFNDGDIKLRLVLGNALAIFFATAIAMCLIDKIGRRKIFTTGSAVTIPALATFTFILAFSPSDPGNLVKLRTWLAIMYIITSSFSYGWLLLSTVYLPETYPLRIRSKAVAIVTSFNYLVSFCVNVTIARAFEIRDWRSYIILIVVDTSLVVYLFYRLPETKGKSLESIDELFDRHSQKQDISHSYWLGSHQINDPNRLASKTGKHSLAIS